jgi:hypothetical protein
MAAKVKRTGEPAAQEARQQVRQQQAEEAARQGALGPPGGWMHPIGYAQMMAALGGLGGLCIPASGDFLTRQAFLASGADCLSVQQRILRIDWCIRAVINAYP